MKGGILRASTCDQAEANTSRVPEFEGWDSLLDDESRCVNQQVTNETVSSFAASVSSFSMPACLIRSSGSPETVIFLSPKYECTRADANYGDGWQDHYLPRPKPIHLIPANVEYQWFINGASDIVAVSWQWERVQEHCPELQSVPASAFDRLSRRGFEDDLIRHLIERIISASSLYPELGKLYTDGLLLSLFLTLLHLEPGRQHAGKRREKLGSAQSRRVIDFMHAHLAEDLAIPDLALLCGVSISHFSRAFKASFGVPPYRYFLRLRVESAMSMLRTGSVPLVTIAQACGFSDQSHFSKVFREMTGMTPSSYRWGSNERMN